MSIARIEPGIYRIESLIAVEPTRVLDLRGSDPNPGTPLLAYPEQPGEALNQKWVVTVADASKLTYSFQAVSPPSNIYISFADINTGVTGNPHQRTPLQLCHTGTVNVYQILVENESGTEIFAFHAPLNPSDPNYSILREKRNPCGTSHDINVCSVSESAKFVAVFLTVMSITSAATPSAITFIVSEKSKTGFETIINLNTNFDFSDIFGPMYTRAAAMGVFFCIGNSAGIVASNVYPASDAPRYTRGHSIALAFSVLSVFVSLGLTIYNYKENTRRDRIYGRPNPDGSDDSTLHVQDEDRLKKYGLEGKTREEIIELGDRHPAFRYTI